MNIELIILVGAGLLLASVLSNRLSDRFGVPSLLLYLLIGMIAGSEGLGGIAFDDPAQARNIGTVALLVILYSGGLDTEWKAIRPVLAPGLTLSTAGVVLTMTLLAVFIKFVLGNWTTFDFGPSGVSWLEAFLLAAIVSSTDASAVFSVFGASQVQPREKLRNLLEIESGSNDPVAVLLTITILGLMTGAGDPTIAVIGSVAGNFLLGGLVGGLVGGIGVALCNRRKTGKAGLFSILVLAWGLAAFGLAEILGGNGYLAVYVAGLVVGNRLKRYRGEVLSFHDGLNWLMQVLMFVMLGLLVFPSQLLPVAAVSVAIALFLILVGRPLAVMACCLPFGLQKNETAYVSWVGLRGSVPIVLATFPATYGIADADRIFHLVFFIVLISVLVQGSSLIPAARRLKLIESDAGSMVGR